MKIEMPIVAKLKQSKYDNHVYFLLKMTVEYFSISQDIERTRTLCFYSK